MIPPQETTARRLARVTAKAWLDAFGWRAIGGPPPGIKKAVVIAAPHTSSWDWPFTMAVGAALDLRVSWMGKHTLFAPPLGTVMRAFGGVSVDRTKRSNTVQSAIDLLNSRDELFLIVAPEGTRARARWKTGFYHIALGANVPILCGFLDFATKTGGLGDVVYPTGNIEEDLGKVRAFYAGIQGKRPERCGEIEVAATRAAAPAP